MDWFPGEFRRGTSPGCRWQIANPWSVTGMVPISLTSLASEVRGAPTLAVERVLGTH